MVLLGRKEPPLLERARIRSTFIYKVRRVRDPDNLIASLKSAIDGLRDCKILKDDNLLTIETPIILIGEKPKLILEVFPVVE